MATVNEDLRDELISQELLIRRATAGLNNAVTRRLAKLEQDLKTALLDIDPGAVTGSRQLIRMEKLRRRSNELTREAFADCRRLATADGYRIAKAAADMSVRALRAAIP
jgi:hypothetical protein